VRFAIPRRLGRLAPVVLAGCALTGVPAVAAADSPCSSAAGQPSTMTVAAVRADTQCLLNRERAKHGLRALKMDSRLSRAALGHSREMVTKRYFAHDSHSGRPFGSRIASTGWMDGRQGWTVGENIAWGASSRSTPRAIVKSWMDSAGHRDNILLGRFTVIGIGVERGTPVAGVGGGITYTTDFGS
jgi:uncharacterized protein YkwD